MKRLKPLKMPAMAAKLMRACLPRTTPQKDGIMTRNPVEVLFTAVYESFVKSSLHYDPEQLHCFLHGKP